MLPLLVLAALGLVMHRRTIKPSRNGSGRHLAPAIYSPAPPKTGCTTCSKVPEQIISNCNRHLCASAKSIFEAEHETHPVVPIIEFCSRPGRVQSKARIHNAWIFA